MRGFIFSILTKGADSLGGKGTKERTRKDGRSIRRRNGKTKRSGGSKGRGRAGADCRDPDKTGKFDEADAPEPVKREPYIGRQTDLSGRPKGQVLVKAVLWIYLGICTVFSVFMLACWVFSVYDPSVKMWEFLTIWLPAVFVYATCMLISVIAAVRNRRKPRWARIVRRVKIINVVNILQMLFQLLAWYSLVGDYELFLSR